MVYVVWMFGATICVRLSLLFISWSAPKQIPIIFEENHAQATTGGIGIEF